MRTGPFFLFSVGKKKWSLAIHGNGRCTNLLDHCHLVNMYKMACLKNYRIRFLDTLVTLARQFDQNMGAKWEDAQIQVARASVIVYFKSLVGESRGKAF